MNKKRDKSALGERYMRFRKAHKLTHNDVSDAGRQRGIFISAAFLSMIENGERSVNLDLFMILFLDFKANFMWLATGTGEMTRDDQRSGVLTTSVKKELESTTVKTQQNEDSLRSLEEKVQMMNALIEQMIKERSEKNDFFPDQIQKWVTRNEGPLLLVP